MGENTTSSDADWRTWLLLVRDEWGVGVTSGWIVGIVGLACVVGGAAMAVLTAINSWGPIVGALSALPAVLWAIIVLPRAAYLVWRRERLGHIAGDEARSSTAIKPSNV